MGNTVIKTVPQQALNKEEVTNTTLKQVHYEQISESEEFKHLVKRKRNFLVPFSIFFLVFYFTLPILTSYTTILNKAAVGGISWAWVFAFAQFIMTWVLCTVYVKKANKFDQMSDEIIENLEQGDQRL
ncbi:uncharacterized membrane protein (DUF485 family) [Oikeobacillus pervagus]|uniref:Uncharacterized membrane protein (DUF485 family) n=1 Tax=Oikeobacillus pervagus TaxID=1325931 RepID=A0AAJ1T133_9BACI|nr:DUF485 domain-containing protein [Oikeobacillus pervagus]MDQ0216623.1 uncharacterized membrane protein (DUF485 family) [Oikeobacillus pervagus]